MALTQERQNELRNDLLRVRQNRPDGFHMEGDEELAFVMNLLRQEECQQIHKEK